MKPAVNNTIISKKIQKYAMHEKDVWKSALVFNFIIADPDLSQCNFCNSGLCKIAWKTFMDSWNKKCQSCKK